MRHAISALLVIALFGCSASNVSYDYDKDVNFTGLRTYDWSKVSRPLQADPLFVKRFKAAGEANLRAKGFTRSSSSPDFVVSLHRSIELRRDYLDGNYPYATYRGYWHYRRPYIYEYEEEILYINFFRTGTKDLIWHAARASLHVPGMTPADREKKANKAAAEILAGFPPTLEK